ncbi:MAG: glycine cleavage system protein GcvH [Proteobacteria bacterium]|nr:glycine cleavage system protein GcvH [Pseudomonadota bacterium]
MNAPDNLKYTKEHEWIKIDGKTATIGITDHAQSNMGDIVYVELPGEGEQVKKDDTFGVVESVKAVSDCYAPISGKVIDVNSVLAQNPETINEDCYGDGWMIKLELADPSELKELMDHTQYADFVAEETA